MLVAEKESENSETGQVLQDSLAVRGMRFSSHLMTTYIHSKLNGPPVTIHELFITFTGHQASCAECNIWQVNSIRS